jgi:rhodanese-related sulfurtransferase
MKKCRVEEFKEALKTMEEYQVIDVREPMEYQSEHIEGSILLPLSGLKNDLPRNLEKNKPVYLLCRSGSRSGSMHFLVETPQDSPDIFS